MPRNSCHFPQSYLLHFIVHRTKQTDNKQTNCNCAHAKLNEGIKLFATSLVDHLQTCRDSAKSNNTSYVTHQFIDMIFDIYDLQPNASLGSKKAWNFVYPTYGRHLSSSCSSPPPKHRRKVALKSVRQILPWCGRREVIREVMCL